jgi:hypothetical protein
MSSYISVQLADVAHARAGDKGSACNIGVIAWDPLLYPEIASEVTPHRVREHLGHFVRGNVVRYDLPHLQAFNFVLEDSLDGGATRSLRLDAQGKTLSSALLMLEIEIDSLLEPLLRRRPTIEVESRS